MKPARIHVPDDPPDRRCIHCLRFEGAGVEFPRGGKVCEVCRLAQQREKRSEKKKQSFRILMATAGAAAKDQPNFQRIVQQMMDRAGGLSPFVLEMMQQFDQAKQNRPGGRMVLDWYRLFFNLFDAAMKERVAALDVEGMSDQQIEDLILGYTEQEVMPRLLNHEATPEESDVQPA